MKLSLNTLYSRFLLMILLPIIIIQIVTIVIFYERHWENVSGNMQNFLINDINTIVNFYIKYKNSNNEVITDLNSLGFKTALLIDKPKLSEGLSDSYISSIATKISNSIKYKTQLFYIDDMSNIRGLIYLPNSQVLQIDFSTKRIKNQTTYIFVIWILTTSILFGLISLFFMKNQVKSIINLDKAAMDFGQGKIYHFKPSGAKEIRSLGLSFLRMRKKILKQIKNRTELLAHIAHDLRTPLTRIKLQLSLINENNDIKNIHDNIKKIEDMINSYLIFAKEEGNEENRQCNLTDIINNIINLLNDDRITFDNRLKENHHLLFLKVDAIDRAITNVVENALKYCLSMVRMNLLKVNDQILIQIEDDGQGIGEKDYKKALEPFNQLGINEKQGYGLGLAITKNIINAHGGDIVLDKSKMGGLKVTIKLPI
ncbi:sensor histidine kinase [Candidatus Bandiella numerosa]|uniref:sensor histidine kinase n=1 Tax=Candidatus Bandiella numerosa TaxID=2570586 RepID=UPI001F360966